MAFQILPGPRTDPFAGANARGMETIMTAITQAKEKRQLRDQKDAILDIYASDATQEEKQIQVAGLFAQPAEKRGFLDFLNPTTASQGVSSLEDRFASAGLENILNPFQRELDQARLKHQKVATRALKRGQAPKQETLRYRDGEGKMRIWRGIAEDIPAIVDQVIEAGGTIDTTKTTMSDVKLDEYVKAVASGDTERADKLLLGGPQTEINIGGQPWQAGFIGQEGMRKEALVSHEQRLSSGDLSSVQVKHAAQVTDDILNNLSQRTFKFGFKNFTRSSLVGAYKKYRLTNNYNALKAEHRKILDDLWDEMIALRNETGEARNQIGKSQNIGKDEYDWDVNDPTVVALREQKMVEELNSDEEKRAELRSRGWTDEQIDAALRGV